LRFGTDRQQDFGEAQSESPDQPAASIHRRRAESDIGGPSGA
jgi:hypothetical protein